MLKNIKNNYVSLYLFSLKVLVLLHLKAVCLCTWVVKRNKWGEAKAVNIHLMICGSALRRYLQKPASSTDTERHKYHFFNTYFYEKLKQDVLRKVFICRYLNPFWIHQFSITTKLGP